MSRRKAAKRPLRPDQRPAHLYTREIDAEIRRRIRLAVASYAYEFHNAEIMPDATFDKLALDVRPELDTGFPVMDKFFRERFSAHTGQWIHAHPDLAGIAGLYARYWA